MKNTDPARDGCEARLHRRTSRERLIENADDWEMREPLSRTVVS